MHAYRIGYSQTVGLLNIQAQSFYENSQRK